MLHAVPAPRKPAAGFSACTSPWRPDGEAALPAIKPAGSGSHFSGRCNGMVSGVGKVHRRRGGRRLHQQHGADLLDSVHSFAASLRYIPHWDGIRSGQTA